MTRERLPTRTLFGISNLRFSPSGRDACFWRTCWTGSVRSASKQRLCLRLCVDSRRRGRCSARRTYLSLPINLVMVADSNTNITEDKATQKTQGRAATLYRQSQTPQVVPHHHRDILTQTPP